jgi:RNA polymerase sigma-70 factor (family 1)
LLPDTAYNEKLLLEALSRGNEPAFKKLYNKYSGGIYAVALKHLKQPQLAEDIVQNLFLKVWENRDALTQIQNFSAWLFAVSRNIIISTLRKQGTQETYLNYLRHRMELHPDTPELVFARRNIRSLISEATLALSPQQRLAFQLQREDGLSYEDIRRQMGIEINTVKAHLYKANQLIRSYLQTRGVDNVAIVLLLLLTSGF